ncbi:MAG: multicopper oxidase domain-containing protein [Solirubrobacterales bacterium]
MQAHLRKKSPRALAATALAATALAATGCGSTELPTSRLPSASQVAQDPAAVPPPITRSRPRRVEVDLVAHELIAPVAPGRRALVWAFGIRGHRATVPGPMIRVMEGDTVVVRLRNPSRNHEPHSIDFHAVIGPGGGSPAIEVGPGETRTLRFRAQRRGAYIYHCAAEDMPWEHIAHGMYGLIEVDPPGGLAPGYREFYVGQNEWYLTSSPVGQTRAGKPFYDLDSSQANTETPDFFTFNGHTMALRDSDLFGRTLRARVGDRVRLFFVDAGPNAGSSFHVVGEIFDRVYGGDPRDAVHNEETVAVPPGSATVLELSAEVPGRYDLVDHAIFRASRGALGMLTVDPQCFDPASCRWPRRIYAPPVTPSNPVAELVQMRKLLVRAKASYGRGAGARADDLVADAYLDHFERVESLLAEQDRELMEGLETLVSEELRDKIAAGAPTEEVASLIDRARHELARAERLLRQSS